MIGLKKLLQDQTLVEIKFTNDNPNSPGGMHTNGPPSAWVRFNEGEWKRARGVASRSTLEARNYLEIADTKADVVSCFLLDIENGI